MPKHTISFKRVAAAILLVLATLQLPALAQSKKTKPQTQTAPQQQIDNREGWYKAKWGMSSSDLSKEFGEIFKKVTSDDTDINAKYSQYVIRDYQLGECQFKILFTLGDNDALSDVLITANDKIKKQELTSCFLYFKEQLTKKYGTEQKNDLSDPFDQTYEWVTASSIINLNRKVFTTAKPASTFVSLKYSNRTNSEKDKF